MQTAVAAYREEEVWEPAVDRAGRVVRVDERNGGDRGFEDPFLHPILHSSAEKAVSPVCAGVRQWCRAVESLRDQTRFLGIYVGLYVSHECAMWR